MRHRTRALTKRAIAAYGPLSDTRLALYLKGLGISRSAATAARRRLVASGEVQRANGCEIAKQPRFRWEATRK